MDKAATIKRDSLRLWPLRAHTHADVTQVEFGFDASDLYHLDHNDHSRA